MIATIAVGASRVRPTLQHCTTATQRTREAAALLLTTLLVTVLIGVSLLMPTRTDQHMLTGWVAALLFVGSALTVLIYLVATAATAVQSKTATGTVFRSAA